MYVELDISVPKEQKPLESIKWQQTLWIINLGRYRKNSFTSLNKFFHTNIVSSGKQNNPFRTGPEWISTLMRIQPVNTPGRSHSPITELSVAPKAQIQCAQSGTWKREKLHLELKYFGSNDDGMLNKREKKPSKHYLYNSILGDFRGFWRRRGQPVSNRLLDISPWPNTSGWIATKVIY